MGLEEVDLAIINLDKTVSEGEDFKFQFHNAEREWKTRIKS